MTLLHRIRRFVIGTALTGSAALSLWSVAQIAENPALRPMIERGADEIVAATDRMMAGEATPEHLNARLVARLAENPRNWIALEALAGIYAERGLPLPEAYSAALDEDSGIVQQAEACAACAYDPAACTLSNVFLCQVPIAFTPIADLSGVTRAGIAYATDAPVDHIDLALSVIGLGATATVLATGGSSALVKAGASMARLARRMGRLSPRLTALASDAVKAGVDWAALPAVRSAEDMTRVIRADAFAPLTVIAADLERLRVATDTPQALHLLPLIDNATDARHLSNAAEALGPRLVGRAEVLGKARLLRATLRFSDIALSLLAGLAGLAISLAWAIGGMIQTRLLRAFR